MEFFKNLFGPRGPKENLDKRFQKIAEAGTGSMCKIYRARDLKLGKTVALKILDPERVKKLIAKDPPTSKRPTEGEIAVKLNHPRVVKTLEHGISTQREPFLVMEFLDAIGLNFLVDGGGTSLAGKRIKYLVEAAEGLAYFHRQNFIHRDICPRNIMVCKDETIKIIDFGLAVPNIPEYRRPGNRTGSITHMAPELLRRSATDERIDIFSLGITAFEVITGRAPFDAIDTLERARQHINNQPKHPRDIRADLDDEMCDFLLKSIAKNPDERIPSMKEFAEKLSEMKRQDY